MLWMLKNRYSLEDALYIWEAKKVPEYNSEVVMRNIYEASKRR